MARIAEQGGGARLVAQARGIGALGWGVARELPLGPYRAVAFRDNDLASALERSATWLRSTESWLGEAVDVSAIHLDYDNGADSPYFEVKLLCNEEDLAGAPLLRRRHQAG